MLSIEESIRRGSGFRDEAGRGSPKTGTLSLAKIGDLLSVDSMVPFLLLVILRVTREFIVGGLTKPVSCILAISIGV